MHFPAELPLGGWLRNALIFLVVLSVVVIAGIVWALNASLPNHNGKLVMAGLISEVTVDFDQHGIPRVQAQNREDAYRALGFVTAYDRLFQMDLLRRRSAGRLAEILGEPLLKADRWHRTMGFGEVASTIIKRLPPAQLAVLKAYSDGINQAMAQMNVYPFEFLLLRYQPEPWRPEDSILIILGMFENLTWHSGEQELRATVMEAALGKEILDFLMPGTDRYTDNFTVNKPWRPVTGLPLKALAKLISKNSQHYAGLVAVDEVTTGSNAWLLSPNKSLNGHALLANDMHLALRVPNIWYRAELRQQGRLLAGLTLPGVPLFISGSNGRVAWGFTSVAGDFVDFVPLEIVDAKPDSYLTPQGHLNFGRRQELIRVKGAADVVLDVHTSIWGPILFESFLGKPVAVHWTALDPDATDLGLMELDNSGDVFQALPVLQKSGGPPLNAMFADSQGNIAWTYVGRIPDRRNLDGLLSRPWTDGTRGWNGYISASEKPRIINPEAGYLVNANQRMVGREYPHVIGQDFGNGYRAFRIVERLDQLQKATESDLLQLQLDTQTEFYRYYQRLALTVLQAPNQPLSVKREELYRDIQSWDGFARTESKGLAVLVEFRRRLADAVLSPYFARCRALDPLFEYTWHNLDEPLQQLLDAKVPELLPQSERYQDWNAFLLDTLEESEQAVLSLCGVDSLQKVHWGCFNQTRIQHPFAEVNPLLGKILNMPVNALPGCQQCVRMADPESGASERLVVSPGNENHAFLQMPGGQSGNPLSSNYRDQQNSWLEGIPTPLLVAESLHSLILRPEKH